jgi:hypothetical protein
MNPDEKLQQAFDVFLIALTDYRNQTCGTPVAREQPTSLDEIKELVIGLGSDISSLKNSVVTLQDSLSQNWLDSVKR